MEDNGLASPGGKEFGVSVNVMFISSWYVTAKLWWGSDTPGLEVEMASDIDDGSGREVAAGRVPLQRPADTLQRCT